MTLRKTFFKNAEQKNPKMLVIRTFSFSNDVFYSSKNIVHHFSHTNLINLLSANALNLEKEKKNMFGEGQK